MHITLYRKYRPSNFKEIAGESEIVETLKNSLKNKSLSHAYLFSGPRGVGKTTVARLIAKGANCLSPNENGEPCDQCENCKSINIGNFPDLIEIDAASNRSIDEIRNLKEKINYQPVVGQKKVYIIDEAHMLTKEAFNALLKTLEEPPSHVIFILATTELDKILATIISRCQRYDFKALTLKEVKDRLQYILKEENYTADEEVLKIVYENSYGSMRDAISILERLLISDNERHISLSYAEKTLGLTSNEKLNKFLNAVIEKDIVSLNSQLEELWYSSSDIESFFKDLAKYCKNNISEKNNKLNLGEYYLIISKIYDAISKFKFEDDKRLMGYVIVNEFLKNHYLTNYNYSQINNVEKNDKFSAINLNNNITNKEVTHYSIENNKSLTELENSNLKSTKNNVENKISFEEIVDNWKDFLNILINIKTNFRLLKFSSKLTKLENNNLYILFDRKSIMIKETLEEKENKSIMETELRKFFKCDELNVIYYINQEQKSKEEKNKEFNDKVIKFFSED